MKCRNNIVAWIKEHSTLCGVIIGVCLSLLVNRLAQDEVQGILIRNDNELHNSNSNYVQILEDQTVAKQLFHQVKIMCLIFPRNETLVHRLPSIFQTWGKRCNHFIAFVQHHKNVVDLDTTNNFSTVYINIGSEKRDAWRLTVMSFLYLNKTKLLDKYDWFLRTNANSYIVMENIRFLLYSQEPDLALHFDNSIEPDWNQSQQVVPSLNIWNRRAIFVMLSKSHTLHDVRRLIRQGSGTDPKKRFIHFPCFPSSSKQAFMQNMTKFSNYPVGFRHLTYDLMFALEYLIYYLHPYGINVLSESLPNKNN